METISKVKNTKTRPERVLQFGEGNFLRAFVDWQVDLLNEKTDFNGNVVLVQPLERGMGEMINAQKGLYTTILRGIREGAPFEQYRTIDCVSRCLNPYKTEEFVQYQPLADSTDLRFIISNTTEAGITYRSGDSLEDTPQSSFPGKICAFLFRRFKTFAGATDKGIILIPCELIENNGDTLKKTVKQFASEWNLGQAFITWLDEACDFCNSLVDRIVPGYPKQEAAALCQILGYQDNLLDSAELFYLWVIECHKEFHEDELPLKAAALNVIWTHDMSFYRDRKVRILNGSHTMMALAAYQCGLETVEECIHDSLLYQFLYAGIFDEIIPSMEATREILEPYATEVLERFQNPYLRHQLLSISLNSIRKFKNRDLPSLLGFIEKNNRLPQHLVFSLAALISFYEGTEFEGPDLKGSRDGELYLIKDSYEVLSRFAELYGMGGDIKKKAERLSSAILAEDTWWGQDLTKIKELESMVSNYLVQIWTKGMKEALKEII
ncbi:tagaturonate reductase [uncultured Sphaerochaeta sp.]|uniref:tagaturonate reductase n=1 Tax=uncultured Sphaerochaeta sp. TaxID=886478 RepID=UPI002A0A5F55|nr:tagaturonate reductase [uncultured Sphaerochaeta sp.]